MVFAVIFLIIIPILGIVCIAKASYWEWDGWIIGLIAGIGLFFIGLFSTGLCAYLPGENLYQNGASIVIAEEERDEIFALTDNAYIKRYHDDSNIKYSYFTSTEKGQKTKTINGDNAFILTIPEGEQPYIIHKTNLFENFFLRILFFCPEEYFIYVPEGTIVDQFNIDLQ